MDTINQSEKSGPDFFATGVDAAKRFYLGGYPPGKKRLIVTSGGRENCLRDYLVDREDFPYYSIEFVAKGTGKLALAGNSHRLSAGDVFTYGPGISHRITSDADHPLVKYFVDFTGSKACEWMSRYGQAPGTILHVPVLAEITRIFDDLIYVGKSGGRHGPMICATILERLILTIAESMIQETGDSSGAFFTYEHCRRYIRDHYLKLWNLTDIAEQCYVDPAYLCRLFRRFDEQTPYQYLIRLKMSYAAERLREPKAMVKQVARELNFSDAFGFSRMFKRVFGLSPDRFRRLR